MTWRERIASAQERGFFTQDDRDAMTDCTICMVGETAAQYGWAYIDIARDEVIDRAELHALTAVRWGHSDFATAMRSLEVIEDRALQLKREGNIGER